MTPARWDEVKALFAEAISRPEDARATFLHERCRGNEELLAAVTRLLAAHTPSGDFLEQSPVAGLPAAVMDGRWSHEVRGAYRLGRRIGMGGMGEVYEAWHTGTGDRVAVKVLAEGSDRAGHQLRREARHAALLDHPGICQVREVVEDDDGAFIAMEFIDGSVLADALPRGGFDPVTATAIASELAGAIAHAHDRGVVHRDLKSANLMLTRDGSVKVLDFGLARRLPGAVEAEVSAATSQTEAGVIAGTLAYLAPEVLRGERADARSDVWAFGVVLHELLTGRLPFEGRTPFALTSAVLSGDPAPLPAGLPAGLRAIRDNCLGKDRGARYQNGREVLEAFRVLRSGGRVPRLSRRPISHTWRRAAVLAGAAAVLVAAWVGADRLRQGSAPTTTALAVLPLQTTDAQGEYFAEGMTDAITARLGTVEALRVIARTSAMRFRDETSMEAIGRALRVDAVVTGSVDRRGDRVQLSVELTDTSTGRTRWRDTFDRDASEVLALEGEAVRAIADAIGITVSTSAANRLAVVRAVAPAVHEDYLKGRFYWNQRTTESIEQAVGYFQSAIARDPTYAPAHAALADCYNQFATFLVGTGSPAEFRPLARAAAIAAIQADESLAEAHATLGYVSHYGWDWVTAEREFQRALALNPNLALAHIWYGNFLITRGRDAEAVAAVERAEQLDPFSRVIVTNVGWTLSLAGRSDDAIAAFERALELDPDYIQAHIRLAGELGMRGRHAEAIAEAERVVKLSARRPSSVALLGHVLARAGRHTEAEAVLSELVEMARSSYVSPVGVYQLYFLLGDTERGFEWLEKAVAERANGAVYIGREDPLRPYRGDPRYRRIARQVGLPDGG